MMLHSRNMSSLGSSLYLESYARAWRFGDGLSYA